MRTLEHVLFSFLFAGVNSISLLYFLFWKKKGFENRVFEIRKHGSTRRSVLIYIYIIYIYTGKESRKHPYHPFPFIFFYLKHKKVFNGPISREPVLLVGLGVRIVGPTATGTSLGLGINRRGTRRNRKGTRGNRSSSSVQRRDTSTNHTRTANSSHRRWRRLKSETAPTAASGNRRGTRAR